MKTQIRKVNSTDQFPACWEWLAESAHGEFMAGGYCATEADTKADLAHWLAGHSILSAPSVIKSVGHAL